MMNRLTPTVKNLLLINVIIYVIAQLFGLSGMNRLMGLYYFDSPYFYPFQFFTYMFSHGGFTHILFNMLGLFFLGPLLEQFWGAKKFLTFYLLTGIGAGFIYLGLSYFQISPMKEMMDLFLYSPDPESFYAFISEYDNYSSIQSYRIYEAYADNPGSSTLRAQAVQVVQQIYSFKINIPMVGASGAIYGILMAFGFLFPNTELMLLFPPIPIKAKYLVLILGGMAVYSGFSENPGDNTAHFAHLGGIIVSYIILKFWQQGKKDFY
ncbi:MAG: rhomboid family intramembrane serine protease [Bacteroidetes bacterium]|nr:rhomboid family intramembrane serine protease [Bacteroidota bacterium]MDA1121425.1 rhomboid family intramembrane serine protease [Bacteroidota bacterium]